MLGQYVELGALEPDHSQGRGLASPGVAIGQPGTAGIGGAQQAQLAVQTEGDGSITGIHRDGGEVILLTLLQWAVRPGSGRGVEPGHAASPGEQAEDPTGLTCHTFLV